MSSVRKLCILIILLCIVFAVQIMATVRDPVAVVFAIVPSYYNKAPCSWATTVIVEDPEESKS